MTIYLAGGITGNINKLWKEYMNLYLAGTYSRPYCIEQAMNLYLAGVQGKAKGFVIPPEPSKLFILESFYYMDDWMPKLINQFGSFLLDSGAFTFMSNAKVKVDWDEYVTKYANFIIQNDIKLFFELDIDSVVGLKEVERLRLKLETMTGKKCIPVWHYTRGKEYFLKMCDSYPYVAIGGLVTKELPLKTMEKYFPWFISEAHKRGCKIHGLGYTNLKGLKRFKFDSVDSTAWLYGNRGGFVYKFNPKMGTVDKICAPAGARLHAREAAIHNFNEWVKFQRYAENHY